MLLKTVHINVCNVYFLYSSIYNLLVFYANKSIYLRQLTLTTYYYYLPNFISSLIGTFGQKKKSILPLLSAVCGIAAVPYSVTTALPFVALPAALCNGMALDLQNTV